MTSTPGPASTGRLVCPKCGANNFNTQAACWQCGAGLRGNGVPSAMRAADGAGDEFVAPRIVEQDPTVPRGEHARGGVEDRHTRLLDTEFAGQRHGGRREYLFEVRQIPSRLRLW